MKRIRCYVKVAKYCLLETVQTLYEQGAKELAIGKEDNDWGVSAWQKINPPKVK